MSSPNAQAGENGQGGLKRSSSRGNLAGSTGASSGTGTSMAAFQAAALAANAAASSTPRSPVNTQSATSFAPGLLKRSRSMGTFDSFISRDINGADAIEAISNRAIPQPVTASSAPSATIASTTATKKSTASPVKAVADDPPSSSSSSNSLTSLSTVSHDLLTSPLDDSQLHHEPLARVDYFSHNWNESDLSSSWRYIVSRRQEMANSARLENASWRTWAKAKYNLKTVSPESLNWLKDYDVTWLYGPLYHEPSSHASASTSQTELPPRTTSETDATAAAAATATTVPGTSQANTTASSARSSTRGGPKSILKKKTLAQIMLEDTPGYVHGHSGSETTNYLRHHIYRQVPTGQNRERMAALLNRQYEHGSPPGGISLPSSPDLQPSVRTTITGSLPTSITGMDGTGSSASLPGRPSSHRSVSQASAASLASLSSTTSQGSTRRVHFNDRVEQCIALDIDESAPSSPNRRHACGVSEQNDRSKKPSVGFAASLEADDHDDDDEDDDEDDEGGLFLGMRRHDLNHDTGSHTIIAPLPATTLKYEDDESEPEKITAQIPTHRGVRAGFNANYDYSSVYKIVDPKVKAVPMPGEKSEVESQRKVQPVASFGLDNPSG